MELLQPEEETLKLLATELGFIYFDERSDRPRPPNDASAEKPNCTLLPALQKPFTQLT